MTCRPSTPRCPLPARSLATLALFAGLVLGGQAAGYVPEGSLFPQGGLSDDQETQMPGVIAPDGDPTDTPRDPMMEGEPADDHFSNGDATSVPSPARASLDDVRYGSDGLPPQVNSARDALLKAARSGDIEALRPIFDGQRVAPIVAPFEQVQDAVAHLRLQSGDARGQEILAILLELLEGGHVMVGEGSTRTFVWPYFAEVPLGELEAPHMVELYRILTSIDVEEVERQGRYTFFRVGIAPDGRVRYFSAGEVE
ncbi:MAG: hypothetical protein AAF615_03750 [Pseudomonadota bacterium]